MPRPSATIVKKKQITCLSQYLVICVFIVPVLFDGQRKKHQVQVKCLFASEKICHTHAQWNELFGKASNIFGRLLFKNSNSKRPSEAIQQVSTWHQRSLLRVSVFAEADEWQSLIRPSGVSNGRRPFWAVHARFQWRLQWETAPRAILKSGGC